MTISNAIDLLTIVAILALIAVSVWAVTANKYRFLIIENQVKQFVVLVVELQKRVAELMDWQRPPIAPDNSPSLRGLNGHVGLFDVMVQAFNVQELKTLATDLGVNPEVLAGENPKLEELAREILMYFYRQKQTSQVYDYVWKHRPTWRPK